MMGNLPVERRDAMTSKNSFGSRWGIACSGSTGPHFNITRSKFTMKS